MLDLKGGPSHVNVVHRDLGDKHGEGLGDCWLLTVASTTFAAWGLD